MFNWRDRLFPLTEKEKHTDEVREATHHAINELQGAILDYQRQSKRDKKKIIDMLTKSEKDLNSVAEKIAIATGANRRTN